MKKENGWIENKINQNLMKIFEMMENLNREKMQEIAKEVALEHANDDDPIINNLKQ